METERVKEKGGDGYIYIYTHTILHFTGWIIFIYMYKVKKFVKSSLSYCSFDSTFQTSRYYHKVGILMETHADPLISLIQNISTIPEMNSFQQSSIL